MRKNWFRYLSAALCVAMLCTAPVSAFAETKEQKEKKEKLNDSKDELNNAKDEQKATNDTIKQLNKEIEGLEEAKDQLTDYVVELDTELMGLQDEIDVLQESIDSKSEEVEQTREDLRLAQEQSEQQYIAMKQRIKFMYERGDSAYLSLVLNADSFSDMLNKAEYVEEISAYDRRMLTEYQTTVEMVTVLSTQLEEEEKALEVAMGEATDKQSDMNDLIEKKKDQIDEYEEDITDKEESIKQYKADLAAQNATIAALEAQVAAAEQAYNDTLSGNSTGTAQKVYTGAFCWPAPQYTRISSEYGYRVHPTLGYEKFHNGVDMAAPGGSPILAAQSGTVVAASYNASMGNYIMINHGGGVYTIYMHASALYVSTGATVTKGQKIAAVGTTGRSTGNHLHFTVRVNGAYVNPMSYL